MADRPFIGFEPDPKTARAVEAERKRLSDDANGTHVGGAQAVRSLVAKALAVEDKADA